MCENHKKSTTSIYGKYKDLQNEKSYKLLNYGTHRSLILKYSYSWNILIVVAEGVKNIEQ
jgi:hypothetical protein